MFFIGKRAFEKAVEKRVFEIDQDNQRRENHYRICTALEELDERVKCLERVMLRAKRKAVKRC